LTSTAGSATGSSTSSSVAAWIAVLLAIIPCLSESLVVLTYKTVRPLLVNVSTHVSRRVQVLASFFFHLFLFILASPSGFELW
jgi:hypothetical protein